MCKQLAYKPINSISRIAQLVYGTQYYGQLLIISILKYRRNLLYGFDCIRYKKNYSNSNEKVYFVNNHKVYLVKQ